MLCWHALNSKVLEIKHKVDGQTFLHWHGNMPHSGPKRLFHLGIRAFGCGEWTLLQPITESKSDWVQMGPLGQPSPTPSSSRATQSRLPRTTSTQPRSPHMHVNYWTTAVHKSPLAGLDQLWSSDLGSCLYPISNLLKLNSLHFQLPQEHISSLLAGQQCKLPLAFPVPR